MIPIAACQAHDSGLTNLPGCLPRPLIAPSTTITDQHIVAKVASIAIAIMVVRKFITVDPRQNLIFFPPADCYFDFEIRKRDYSLFRLVIAIIVVILLLVHLN